MEKNRTAMIAIDSGFSQESMSDANHVIAFIDLVRRRSIVGAPYLSQSELGEFANDPGNHGSVVLSRLRRHAPNNPLILIRAINPESGVVRTTWRDGEVTGLGWTEAYLQAVAICQERGIPSVANCSFGGVVHAADGTGWEAFQLMQVTGKSKPGHIVVAAAGAGDGRACHASFVVQQDSAQTVEVHQKEGTHYNLWGEDEGDWVLEVYHNHQHVQTHDGSNIPLNLWKPQQQLNFFVPGEGLVHLRVRRTGKYDDDLRFHCFIVGDTARFHDHVDPTLIVEPAAFAEVIAVGLSAGIYAPKQGVPGHKPDVLLPGGGPVSFRAPEVVALVAAYLDGDANLDVESVKARLGKYPLG